MPICQNCKTEFSKELDHCPNCGNQNLEKEPVHRYDAEDEPIDLKAPSPVYEKKEDKYQEMISSAYTFLVIGVAGLIVLLLVSTGILKLESFFSGNIMLTITAPVLFAAFVLYGIYLIRRSKTVAKEADSENQLTKDIMEWFCKNVTRELLENDVVEDSLEEEKYYKRIDNIKHLLQKTYGVLEEGYLDKLADDIYQEFYTVN